MVSAMIVDDEYLLRSLIRNSIDWDSLGIEIVAEAVDGEDALKKMQQFHPDMALIDINIPFINGLELTKIVYEEKLTTKVIILTGYSDFEYARKAIKYKAANYIVKPIDAAELTKSIEEIRDEIINEKSKTQNLINLKAHFLQSQNVMKEKFLHSLIFSNSSTSKESISSNIEKFDIHIESQNIRVLAVEKNNAGDESEHEVELDLFAVSNIATEIISDYRVCETVIGMSDYIYIIINSLQNETEKDLLIKECNEICAAVNRYLGFSVSIGIGRCYSGYEKLYLSLTNALDALERHFYDTDSCVFYYEESDKRNKEYYSYSFINLDEIIINLRTANFKQCEDIIEGVFDRIDRERPNMGYVKIISLNLVTMLVYMYSENNLICENMFDAKNIIDDIKKYESVESLHSFIQGVYKKFFEDVENAHINLPQSSVVIKAKEYIENNYFKNDTCSKTVSEKLFVNQTYISSLFKKEMKCSITEFITNCRMKKAIELIELERNMNIVDIAEKVGYTDQYYFSKCFKKYTGVSPSKFLNNKLIKKELG